MTAPKSIAEQYKSRGDYQWQSQVISDMYTDIAKLLNDYYVEPQSLRINYVEDDRVLITFRGVKLTDDGTTTNTNTTDKNRSPIT